MELPYCKPDLVREDAQLSRKRARKAASFWTNPCVFPFGQRTPEMSVIPWLTWQTMTGNESFPQSCGGSMLKFSLTVRLNVFVWGVELWHGPLILLGISRQFGCILGHSHRIVCILNARKPLLRKRDFCDRARWFYSFFYLVFTIS